MREEILTLREELSRTSLDKDMLEQQRLETDSLISQIEKSKGNQKLDRGLIFIRKFYFIFFNFNCLIFRRRGTRTGTDFIREI